MNRALDILKERQNRTETRVPICLRGLRHFTKDSTDLTLSVNDPTHIYFCYLTRGEGPAAFTFKDTLYYSYSPPILSPSNFHLLFPPFLLQKRVICIRNFLSARKLYTVTIPELVVSHRRSI